MPTRCLSLACTLAAIMLGGSAPGAHADDGQAVHRCAGRHGEIVFSGLPCTAGSAVGASTPAVEPPARAARTCPHSREELRDRVAAAIARRDANALAGLLRWNGIGAGAAASRLHILRRLTAQPLLAIEDGYGNRESGSGGLLHVRTGSGDSGGVHEHSFDVSIAAGCHWLVW